MRSWFVAAAATGLLMVAAGPAFAHAGLTPGELPPNTTAEAEVVLVHGCGPNGTIPDDDESAIPTTAVTLLPPDGLDVLPHELEGWSLETRTTADGQVEEARWEATDPAGTLGAIFFGVELTVGDLDEGTELWMPIVQDCVGGEQLAWAYEGVAHGNNHFPAMRLTVTSSAVTTAADEPGGLSTGLIVVLAIAIAAIAGGGVFAVSGRR